MIAPPSRSFEESPINVEDLLTELQPCPGIGIAILDDQLRFKAVNPALAHINGVPAIQHIGKTIADVLGDVEQQVSPFVRAVLASGHPLLYCEVSGKLPTRPEKGYWIGHYFPLKDSSGRVARLGAVVLDVTPQRRVERLIAPFAGKGSEIDPTLETVEREYIVHILKKVNGKVAGPDGAAAKLGLKRTTLQSRLNKLGIDAHDYK